MLLFFLIGTALVLGVVKYITRVSVSQQLYKVYKRLYRMLVSYPRRQGLPNKLFVLLKLYYLHNRRLKGHL
jgi:hypothetical protein